MSAERGHGSKSRVHFLGYSLDPKPNPNPNPNPPTIIDDGNTPADPGTDIEEPDVPVSPAQPPKTGDSMGLWIAAALVSGMGLVWLALSGKKREERA